MLTLVQLQKGVVKFRGAIESECLPWPAYNFSVEGTEGPKSLSNEQMQQSDRKRLGMTNTRGAKHIRIGMTVCEWPS